jgi:hypothetical protein
VKIYIELALKYPELSTDEKKRDEQVHEWFATFMLIMLQEVLGAYAARPIWSRARSRKGHWEKFAERQIDLFREDLRLLEGELDDYGPEVSRLTRRLLQTK